jgi:ribose 1,5-bisphosphokinase PhnN
VGGFKAFNQLIQSPKESVHWAAHAKSDGLVQKITDAPQGGKYIFVNNEAV